MHLSAEAVGLVPVLALGYALAARAEPPGRLRVTAAIEPIEGVLELTSQGHSFLRRDPNWTPSREDLFVSNGLIRQFSLRSGQWIVMEARPVGAILVLPPPQPASRKRARTIPAAPLLARDMCRRTGFASTRNRIRAAGEGGQGAFGRLAAHRPTRVERPVEDVRDPAGRASVAEGVGAVAHPAVGALVGE